MAVRIGVLALQGSFSEHVDMLKSMGVATAEVRVAQDLVGCDGLIFPGGESTAMALIGEKCGIFPALRDWVQRCKVWPSEEFLRTTWALDAAPSILFVH